MDIRKIGIVLIIVGVGVSLYFFDNKSYLVPALTVTVLGFFMVLVGFLEQVIKMRKINEKLNTDVNTIIQPLISKYSNLNKQYIKDLDGDEYVKKRIQLNKDLEKELTDNLPYLESREIKKIVIEFNREQDKMR